MDYAFKLTTKLFVFVLLFSLSSSSYALVKGIGFRSTYKTTPLGVKTTAKLSSGSNIYTKAIDIGMASLGAVFTKRAFSPWGAAVVGALGGLGYLLKESTQEIVTGAEGDYATQQGTCHRQGGSTEFTGTLDSCIDWLENYYSVTMTQVNIIERKATSQTVRVKIERVSGATQFGNWFSLSTQPLANYDTITIEELIDTTEVATDVQIATDLLPQLSDEVIADLLIDPVTGLPDDAITELDTAETEIQDEIDLLNDADPFNDPAPELLTPVETIEEAAYKDALESEPYEDPCIKNPNRVGCLDVGTELGAVEIPTITPDFNYTPILLAGNASCPAPPVAQTSKGDFALDNQPLCDFLNDLSPVVITVCTFLSIYIAVGGIRNG